MTSTGSSGGSLPPNFFLTPQQQSLLFTALNANNPKPSNTKTGLSLSPDSFSTTPLQNLDSAGFQESPLLDNYDYDFGDSTLDFSFSGEAGNSSMIGDMPGDTAASSKSDSTIENDTPEKRSHPDDEDDETSPGNESKRRESTDKVPKKPGRKPLTSEPTSKRKAQNRAAQRAFRERKEKHLKDLETKVDELEKASAAANHENSMLRAQVELITTELSHYKQRMTLISTKTAPSRDRVRGFGAPAVSNINDVNFQFEFPKFGSLPTPPANKPHRSSSQPISPQSNMSLSPAASQNNEKSSQLSQQAARHARFKEDLAKFSGIYTPMMGSSNANGSRASVDSVNFSLNGATSSPSASSHSNVGAGSPCGTSPESYTQSPMGFKPVDTLTTIGEENPPVSTGGQPFSQFANLDFSNTGFDWLVQQNGGQFDPQLFGDYREPQENVLSNPSFDDLFNDSLEADFFTPYNAVASPNTHKKNNLIDDIDARQDSCEDEVPKTQQMPPNMSCNQLWEKLQSCPKAQNGEFDLDGLCTELTKKAKCSGTGPVVAESDFDTILKKYMGKDVSSECMADKLGISVDKSNKADSMP